MFQSVILSFKIITNNFVVKDVKIVIFASTVLQSVRYTELRYNRVCYSWKKLLGFVKNLVGDSKSTLLFLRFQFMTVCTKHDLL